MLKIYRFSKKKFLLKNKIFELKKNCNFCKKTFLNEEILFFIINIYFI